MSQAVEPRGTAGWFMAWAYRAASLLYRSQYETIAGLLDLQPDDDLLDVACGSGLFLRTYATHVRHVAGLDHSHVQIKMARRRNHGRIAAGSAELVVGDASKLPWEEGAFSALTCDSLQGFPDPVRSLAEMRRVLRPGGRVVLACNYYPDKETARQAKEQWGLQTWDEAELERLLGAAGFSQIAFSRNKNVVFARALTE